MESVVPSVYLKAHLKRAARERRAEVTKEILSSEGKEMKERCNE